MEVEGLGARCALPSCQFLDYLPLKCSHCLKQFCSEHHQPKLHHCQAAVSKLVPTCPLCHSAVPIPVGQSTDVAVSRHIDAGCPKRHRAYPVCTFPSCNVRDPAATVCVACRHTFCVAHCVEVNHDCHAIKSKTKSATPASKPSPAKSRRQSNRLVPSNASVVPDAGRIDFANRQSAPLGDSSVSIDHRLHLSVFFPANTNLQPRHMFFNVNYSPGKIVDHLHKQIPQLPKPPQGNRYSLYAVKKDLAGVNLLPYITPLKNMSDVVQSGDTIVLQVGDDGLSPAWLTALQALSNGPPIFNALPFGRKLLKPKTRTGTKCLVA